MSANFLFVEQRQLARPDEHRGLHRALGFLQGRGFAGVVARLPAVDPVPLLLRAELDEPEPLLAEPIAVGQVAAFPERLLPRALRHLLLPSRHSTHAWDR